MSILDIETVMRSYRTLNDNWHSKKEVYRELASILAQHAEDKENAFNILDLGGMPKTLRTVTEISPGNSPTKESLKASNIYYEEIVMKNLKSASFEIIKRKNLPIKTLSIVLIFALFAAFFAMPSSLGTLAAQDKDDLNTEITFTKWITTAPNMAGIVGGEVGDGAFAGEILDRVPGDDFTSIEALYHINGGDHSFTAHVFVKQNMVTKIATIRGVVTDGWLKGRQVSGSYIVISCPDQTNGVCFQGTLRSVPTTGPEIVHVTTADGRTLEAQYWALPTDETPSKAPAVVVMHALHSTQSSGVPLVEPLLQAGYHVLFSDWHATDSLEDIQLWMDWLRDQPTVRPDAISMIGSGIGATGAIISCANDDQCVTVIAVSPGIAQINLSVSDSLDVLMESALADGLSHRSVLLIATQGDPYADPENMIPYATGQLARGEIGLRIYSGSAAREALFTSPEHGEKVIQLIISWLNEHTPVVS
jgi:hypothetical protein